MRMPRDSARCVPALLLAEKMTGCRGDSVPSQIVGKHRSRRDAAPIDLTGARLLKDFGREASAAAQNLQRRYEAEALLHGRSIAGDGGCSESIRQEDVFPSDAKSNERLTVELTYVV